MDEAKEIGSAEETKEEVTTASEGGEGAQTTSDGEGTQDAPPAE